MPHPCRAFWDRVGCLGSSSARKGTGFKLEGEAGLQSSRVEQGFSPANVSPHPCHPERSMIFRWRKIMRSRGTCFERLIKGKGVESGPAFHALSQPCPVLCHTGFAGCAPSSRFLRQGGLFGQLIVPKTSIVSKLEGGAGLQPRKCLIAACSREIGSNI